MENSDGFPSSKHQRTKILPLRWFANWCNHIGSNHLVKAVDLDEYGNNGLIYKYHAKMWNYLDKPYRKWGTYYTLDLQAMVDFWENDSEFKELMKTLGSDYDEHGIPYWDKF
jgi:hypothetical protein